jgi:hypothetical protein
MSEQVLRIKNNYFLIRNIACISFEDSEMYLWCVGIDDPWRYKMEQVEIDSIKSKMGINE